ncbi:MAG: hypothetical protein M3271_02385, partial [Actinomycetota bacterium]|nr:hypothetical protein [Actinomycetota bacterium]
MIEEQLRRILHEVAGEVSATPGHRRVIAKARRRIAATSALLVLFVATAAVTSAAVLRSASPVSDVGPAEEGVVLERGERVLPEPGHLGVSTPVEDQATVFAIRAVAHAGLMDPLGYFFGFTSIEEADGGWRVGFGGGRCGVWESDEGTYETCKPLSGEDRAGNAVEDAWLEVGLEDGTW